MIVWISIAIPPSKYFAWRSSARAANSIVGSRRHLQIFSHVRFLVLLLTLPNMSRKQSSGLCEWPLMASSVPCSNPKNRPILNHFALADHRAFWTSCIDGLETVHKQQTNNDYSVCSIAQPQCSYNSLLGDFEAIIGVYISTINVSAILVYCDNNHWWQKLWLQGFIRKHLDEW